MRLRLLQLGLLSIIFLHIRDSVCNDPPLIEVRLRPVHTENEDSKGVKSDNSDYIVVIEHVLHFSHCEEVPFQYNRARPAAPNHLLRVHFLQDVLNNS